MKQQQNISEALQIAKSIAILSVILAHSPLLTDNLYIIGIKWRLSAIGVPMFLFISAYYFNPPKYQSLLNFFESKKNTIILPWIVIGSIMYLWVQMQRFKFVGLTLLGWFEFIIGKGTFLYYLPMLLLCYMIFFYFYKNDRFLYSSVLITVLSLMLTSFGYMDAIINGLNITNYLNIFNWIGYFSIGLIAKKYCLLERLFISFKTHCVNNIIITLYIVSLLLCPLVEPGYGGYFSKLGFIMQLFAIIIAIYISSRIKFHKETLFNVGRYSYSIYLIHFIPIRLYAFITDIIPELSYIAALVILIICYLILSIGRSIAKVLNLENVYCTLLGIRT